MTSADHHSEAKLYPQERHARIVELVARDGRVEVTQLAEELDVTTETVRRDLTKLVRQGLVRRVHGGAIHVERLAFEPSVVDRGERFQDEKERIARAAVELIPQGASILLDSGTTTLAITRLLPPDLRLTVVTNSIPAAAILSSMPMVDLHMLGGRVRKTTSAAVGVWGSNELSEVVVDIAFMGTNGVTVEHGLTTPNYDEGTTKQAMIRSARRCVLVTDSSKVGCVQFYKVGDLGEIDTMITDTGLDDETAEGISKCGPDVMRV